MMRAFVGARIALSYHACAGCRQQRRLRVCAPLVQHELVRRRRRKSGWITLTDRTGSQSDRLSLRYRQSLVSLQSQDDDNDANWVGKGRVAKLERMWISRCSQPETVRRTRM